MKFLQLLGKELNEWPQGISAITQDIGTSVWGFSSDKALPICDELGFWYSPADIGLGMCEIGIDDVALSSDHATAIVTRADWKAERAKLKATKANGNGWVRNRGRSDKSPVDAGLACSIKFRDGSEATGGVSTLRWLHNGGPADVMRFKIHKPAEQPVPVSEPESELLYDPVAQGPLQWRDRIRELDTQRAEVESDYQRQISEIAQERESLVQKLAGEGLALVEVVRPGEEILDWTDWKIGDVLTSTADGGGYTSGKTYKFLGMTAWGTARTLDDDGKESGMMPFCFAWHSRPAS